MKSKFLVGVVTLVLLVALILPACAQPAPAPAPSPAPSPTPSPATTGPKTLKLSYTMPKGVSLASGFEWWGPEFEKRTQGRYKVEIYPGATLVSIPAALESVKKGVAEVVMTSIGSFPKDFPLSMVVHLPTLGLPTNNEADMEKAYEATWELYNTFPKVQAEYKDFKLLWSFKLESFNLVSKRKEVHYPSDFKGMKVGGGGPQMEIVTANGGASVMEAPPQIYTNIDKGVTEASFLTFAHVDNYKLQEICNYYYEGDFGNGSLPILMNLQAWNAMSPADQKIMMDSWRDASKVCATGTITGRQKGKKVASDKGMKIVQPTADETAAWENAATTIAFKKWEDDAKSVGIDAGTIGDVLNGWKKIRAKYMK